MDIYNRLKKDITKYYKARDTKSASLLKVLVSDIQRDPNKDYSDTKVIKVIQNTIKKLKDAKQHMNVADDIRLLKQYLPDEVTEQEILDYLETIDFSKLKAKAQAIGIVGRHFKSKGKLVDMSKVAKLVNNL